MSPLHSDPVGAGSGLAGAPTGSRRGRPDAFGDRPEALSGPSGSAPGRSSGANRGSGLAGGRPNPGGGGPDRSGDRPDPAGGGGGGTGAARGGPGAGLSGAVAAGPAGLSPRPLLGLGLPELQDWCVEQGQPAFRARQLQEWIYERGARSLAAITVLPKAWRQQLAAVTPGLADSPAGSSLAADTQPHSSVPRPSGPPAPLAVAAGPFVPAQAAVLAPGLAATAAPSAADAWIGRSRELLRSESRDGTVKLLLGTADGLSLETVGIPSGERLTVCVSSQVGCPMACRFCATGKGGLQRSLALHEIIDQVLSIREVMGRRPSHVVFMGMGEPLLNLETVLAAIDCLCTDLGMAQRQITISTVGVPAALPSLAERALQRLGRAQFTLAVSLHAPDQALRQRLIPTAHAYPLERLLDDCRRYVAITGRRVSFEYILLGGVNDQPRHAEALARRLRGFQSHVNLIAYNPIAEEEFRRPSPEAVEAFRHALQQRRIAVSVRASRGLDADAACGQLRRRLVGGAPATRQREARAD